MNDPLPVADSAVPAVRLESVIALDATGYWLSGWAYDSCPEEAELSFVTPDGIVSTPAHGTISFHARPDIQGTDGQHSIRGFHAYVELAQATRESRGWAARMRSRDGAEARDVAAQAAVPDGQGAFSRAMHVMRLPTLVDEIIEGQVVPALSRIRGAQPAAVGQCMEFGPRATSPEFSVVIPLRRIDRVEHQLIQFAREPDMVNAELTCVIPPSLGAVCRARGQAWAELFNVPFRVAELTGEVTRARAFNLGAEIAEGETLVLMQGDVLPADGRWLRSLKNVLCARDEIAAVAPRLLFVDGSIAHAGAWYVRGDEAGSLERTVPWRGLSAALPATRGSRMVDALSDAFIMVSHDAFALAGGFSEDYLPGADDAGDLSLKLRALGLESWTAEVDMYLLERATSWPIQTGPAITRLNNWMFARRWQEVVRERIELTDRGATSFHANGNHRTRGGSSAEGRRARVEILDVVTGKDSAAHALIDFRVDRPRTGNEVEAYTSTFAFSVGGWAIARDGQPLRIVVRDGKRTMREIVTQIPIREVADMHPDVPGADRPGFRTVVGTLGLPSEFVVDIDAITSEGECVSLAKISGVRDPLAAPDRASMQPATIHTLGRSGSSWLALLLSMHPEIVADTPFQNETRVASYWISVLRSLAEPASYIQAIRPELYPGHWWLGDGRPSPLPFGFAAADMPRWMGSANIDAVARFCHERIEAFYAQLARGRPRPTRYFVEKVWPDAATLSALGELFPRRRDLVLVRDFRDVICSILAFNAKRGFASFGRELTASDVGLVALIRDQAIDLLAPLQRRDQAALLVRYEDLILGPESALTAILSHLEVEATPARISQILAEARGFLPDVQRDHQTSVDVSASIGRWKTDLPDDIVQACGDSLADVLAACGYEPT